jgi:hypothetical protein
MTLTPSRNRWSTWCSTELHFEICFQSSVLRFVEVCGIAWEADLSSFAGLWLLEEVARILEELWCIGGFVGL